MNASTVNTGVASPAGADEIAQWLRQHAALGADLRLDSREICPGDVFVACQGRATDGSLYIEQAIARGAAAVLVEGPRDAAAPPIATATPLRVVDGLRAMLGALADLWYDQPSAAVGVIAVTGTNGKTSTVQWIARALTHAGKPCGAIGTLGATLPDGRELPGALTTPDVLAVHRLLATMRREGAQFVAMEASSIGIEQGRMDGVRVDIAAFTNLSRDHLDYHGTMEAYEAAKAKLFVRPGLTRAVINADDDAGRRLIASLPAERVLAYGIHASDMPAPPAVQARDVSVTGQGQIFTLATSQGEAQIMTGLLGLHNVSNLLLVAGVLQALGWTLSDIARELSAATPVAGRMEIVAPPALPAGAAANGPMVVVDYSHTPDALERALIALRPVARARGGRLVCLFGCGGDRDAGKRPVMGAIAAQSADRVILSNDNPRSEDPDAILAQIQAGIPDGVTPVVERDRARAILHAVWSSAAEDVVLLAGKGHETYQEVAGVKYTFDDRVWAQLALLLPGVEAVSTDTRTIGPGQLFVALSGERFDGHDYLAQAAAQGAVAALVARRVEGASLPQLVVGETKAALGRIGAAWRARFSIPVIAVTGSNGKTTTKEMISAILADWLGEDQRLATAGNFNNDIGVPLTLLRLRGHHQAAVFELGMNHPGEIALLAEMAAPTVGLVNNAQREHQEFMHTVQAVAEENGAVLAALPASGYAVYPGDDAYTPTWDAMSATPRVLRFGLQAGLDVYAEQIRMDALGSRCQLVTPAGTAILELPVPGMHNLRNALAATACALAAGAPLASACRALAAFSPVTGRMQRHQLSDGTLLVDDTYNANPDSVRAAIDVLAQLPAPRALVLGDMGEVGANGPAMHREVGEYARDRGIDLFLSLGSAAGDAATAFGPQARACESVEEIVTALRGQAARAVLVKGSRFMRMERVVKALLSRDGHAPLGQGERHAA
ncbi:UDP-N-acetylmuramoyl-L-alanyl-D-glutamate--2,6-diaminopimelate ligase [Bordetella genomosp. 9]|uniref:bifunctional UDP-N-acetylmuramoyl-L-alanyl-D-glutamate--2, 6-diaminopimelate ligase MurE/UDP-N-acetylmuramoyl-tripeptide--D-alanyl-D-alanine ligase MurF n=1 Tax=Bordetella genomosp. 9 TaxID=1416803 RepID=UPI000A2976B9|nr:bifunctional UDP-N-acetylmuramoyl-L-alanyl-D-glutamate--2,6-diaminopimelate ligase MurE/UDP-N-acetylmuramoyl-tripeptide--D-alanyl-D-alanine ligase MurF [Bordetella genomosp. 9]ARP89580.1 UDP-N-acetylmuramoyl-L-alanyl-D-glutamate--2,6-diaminopimelate ligase [Bordetella genomosp. 9]